VDVNKAGQQKTVSIVNPPLCANSNSRLPSTTKTLLFFLKDGFRINPVMDLMVSLCKLDIVFILIVNLHQAFHLKSPFFKFQQKILVL
jgi:hypothetical protein